MSTYSVPRPYELINMTTAAGDTSWVILHLRNKQTGMDELTRVHASAIPEMGAVDDRV